MNYLAGCCKCLLWRFSTLYLGGWWLRWQHRSIWAHNGTPESRLRHLAKFPASLQAAGVLFVYMQGGVAKYILRYNNRCNYDIYWLCIYIAITSFGSTWCRVLCCLLIRFMFPPALLPKCFCSHYQEQALQAVEFCAIDWLWFIQWESMVYWVFNACLLV